MWWVLKTGCVRKSEVRFAIARFADWPRVARRRRNRRDCRRRPPSSICDVASPSSFHRARCRPRVVAELRAGCSPRCAARRENFRALLRPEFDADRVEEIIGERCSKPSCSGLRRDGMRQRVDAPRDCPQTFRAVIDGIHRGHDREEHLRRADVAGGLVAADVLLARLQREAIGRAALRIVRNADEPARHLALVTRRAWRNKRRAVRRSPAARRSAAWCRPRRRRRIRPAVAAA